MNANSELITRLIAARGAATAFDYVPSLAPDSVTAALAVSAAVVTGLGASVGGWKVGYAPDRTPVASPMYAAGIINSGTSWRLKDGVPLLPEVEIAIRLNSDLPVRPGRPYSREEIIGAIGEVMAVFEIVESRYRAKLKPSYEAGLADDISHGGFVVGASIKDFSGLDLAALRCRLWIDGKLVSDRVGGHTAGDPLAPVIDWASNQQHPSGSLRAGQIITTGNLTPGLERITTPSVLDAELEGIGKVKVTLAA